MHPNERQSFSKVSILPASAPAAMNNAVDMLVKMPRDGGWRHDSITRHAKEIADSYASSHEMLDHSTFKHLFLDNTVTGKEYGQGVYDLLQRWSPGHQPSLSSILLRVGEHFGLSDEKKEDRVYLNTLALAGVLGTEETDLDYHNAAHNQKVALQATRLATASTDLTPHEKAKLMIAAAIHDLGHDGKGNMENGVHVPFRLETKSFELARPYLERMGMSADDLEDIKTMILGTDVTPFGSPDAPARRVAEGKDFPPELSRLEGNPRMLKLTRMLAIADIASSSSLHLKQTLHETWNVANEVNIQIPADATQEQRHEIIVKMYTGFAKSCGMILETVPEAIAVYGDNHKYIHAAMQDSLKTTAHI